ncbi:MAG TPA: DEAD/DEAH box helicase family protein [Planctomycetota bacterium]|nr:DEAD/DEAH box helicase family protein [Planctomycetota bacterium]
MPTDTSERGLESLIVAALTGTRAAAPATPAAHGVCSEPPRPYGRGGYVEGDWHDYDRTYCLDGKQLFAFLEATQAKTLDKLNVRAGDGRAKFFNRIFSQISKRGIVDVLRNGIDHNEAHVDLYYATPTPGNADAAARHAANVFSVTRQLRYNAGGSNDALDLGIFINGLPAMTFELKNSLTNQNTADAIEQYKNDRDPKEPLFHVGRCLVHFAADDSTVYMTSDLKGKDTRFLPFNKGHLDGAGNPPNPHGIKTDYLWKETLSIPSLCNIVERYARLLEEKDERGRVEYKQVFPRYHQLDCVRKLLAHAKARGTGQKYLLQHSAGSGKSNSITWLAHQLVELTADGAAKPVFDSVIVVTDRKVLDKQIQDNIKQFAHVKGVVQAITQGSGQLKAALQQGKKIIITTIQKFPFIVDEIGTLPGNRFAIIIDEAHSSQSGSAAGKMNTALNVSGPESDDETDEDRINRVIESKKMQKNASYFAFTATPKNKTLEIFGVKQPDGTFHAFHTYTMQQAIEEQFILDVLKNYTTYTSYYKLLKKIEDDPQFDKKRAQKKLKKYVESSEYAVRQKTEIMVDHFHDEVIAAKKIKGRAKAMVVTDSIVRAIQYKLAFDEYLKTRKSPYKTIVAFTGEKEYNGKKYDEDTMNGFASSKIPETFKKDDYRFLIVADKFQTGFDQPLLHSMYVDKILSGVKAVQTLSRLNRACDGKNDTFVLDFRNDAKQIKESFEPFYKTTILSEETDPNKLHDLKADLDAYQVYSAEQVQTFAKLFLDGAGREQLDPILDACSQIYDETLDEDGQVDFKSKAKMFVRTYQFLSAVLPFNSVAWERLCTFLKLLVPKLGEPKEDDLSKGILEAIDLDSYRVEQKAKEDIALAGDVALDPVPTSAARRKPEPELDFLSHIVKVFNDTFGNIAWQDRDRIEKFLSEELPKKVAANKEFQNAMTNSDEQNARIAHDKALNDAMDEVVMDHTELYKQYSDNPDFRKGLAETIFHLLYSKRKA